MLHTVVDDNDSSWFLLVYGTVKYLTVK